MVRTYRMWRYVKIVTRQLTDSSKPTGARMTNFSCADDFHKLRTVLGRHYTTEESYVAYRMAVGKGYITDLGNDPTNKQKLSIGPDGMIFASLSGLLEAEAKLLSSFGSLLAVILAAIAIVVSVVALNKPDTTVIELNNGQKAIRQTNQTDFDANSSRTGPTATPRKL